VGVAMAYKTAEANNLPAKVASNHLNVLQSTLKLFSLNKFAYSHVLRP